MSLKLKYFRNLMRIICVFVCVFCMFIVPALSHNNLPSGYTELEYIESTGTQYIDTAYKTTTDINNFKVDMKASIDTSITTDTHWLFGAFDDNITNNQYSIYYVPRNSVFKIGVYYNINIAVPIDLGTQFRNILADGYTLTVDDSSTLKTYSYSVPDLNLYLFANHRPNKIDYAYAGTKISYCTIWDNDTLVRNMIPAKRNSDSVIGMYDTVTNTFFTNSGTGTFIAGPEIVIQIATTKYVETAFADSVSELNTTMGTIKNVVDNTIIQADRIGKLHTGKQTRPDEQCPKGRECLLITEPDGSLHWYPICDANGSVEPIEDTE